MIKKDFIINKKNLSLNSIFDLFSGLIGYKVTFDIYEMNDLGIEDIVHGFDQLHLEDGTKKHISLFIKSSTLKYIKENPLTDTLKIETIEPKEIPPPFDNDFAYQLLLENEKFNSYKIHVTEYLKNYYS